MNNNNNVKKSKINKKSKNKLLKNESNNYTILIVGLLVVILVIYLMNSNSKNNNNDNNNNNNDNNNNISNEGFDILKPLKTHSPIQFELYNINNVNNTLEFIFLPPKPAPIASQVKSYMLLVIGYLKDDSKASSETVETTEQTESEKSSKIPSILETHKIISKEIIMKNKEELQPDELNLIEQGKYKFVIDMPIVKKKVEVSPIKTEEQAIEYKFGLIAVYDDLLSVTKEVENIVIPFPLDTIFNYNENSELLRLGREFRTRLEKEKQDKEIIENPNIETHFKYQQIADSLGGYPDNLLLDDKYSENKLLQSLSSGIIDVKLK